MGLVVILSTLGDFVEIVKAVLQRYRGKVVNLLLSGDGK
jgi:hypothetical protein